MITELKDGLTNVLNQLINRREGSSQNVITSKRLDQVTLRNIYRSGIGSKIVRLKSSYALTDTLEFETTSDEEFYDALLAESVKLAARYMLSFGRGIIVVHQKGDDLSKPAGRLDSKLALLNVFSGDMVTIGNVSRDLSNPRYYKPLYYNVRGNQIHWTRVIDFTYVEPPEFEAEIYLHGGISEFELIYEQLINDGIVERASSAIVEKNSTLFYKVKGFKEALRTKKDKDLISYFSKLEDARSIYGAGLIDDEDSVESVSQALTNLSEVSDISLRRVSMVTGIPVSVLVGEGVRGLNATGENEMTIFQHTIETLQGDYLINPINELLRKFNKKPASFSENQGQTPDSKVSYESKAIENAFKLWQMGEDHQKYLQERDVLKKDDWEAMWGADPDEITPEKALIALSGGAGNGN